MSVAALPVRLKAVFTVLLESVAADVVHGLEELVQQMLG